MPDNLTLSPALLYAFLLALARVGGALVFVPVPGAKGAAEPVRTAFALGLTMALFSRWPAIDAGGVTVGALAAWVLAEAALGIAIGVSIAIVLESFSLAAQILGLQAGYAYASTIDPATEADSGILLVLAQLFAGLLFFALGLDREMLRLFALSFDRIPAGAWGPSALSADVLIRLGGSLFSIGLRLALPVVALLVMVDVAFALLGRLNQQLQLLSLAFPAKMLAALGVLAVAASVFPRVMNEFAAQGWAAVARMWVR
jgi:flagellar biosynthetic protein FliR